MNIFDRWIALKRSRKTRSIDHEITAEGKFQRIYGPRGDFGKVLITATPAEEFSFLSNAKWDSQADNYDDAVFEGIVDELYSQNLGRVAVNTAFTLVEVWWHPVDGSPNAFYLAARDAINSILKRESELNLEGIRKG